jgi:hypothetical protein
VKRCSATSPDLWTIRCQNPAGHAGAHRNNMTVWSDPDEVDLVTNTEAWVDGQVVLAHEREPDIRGLP